jgi:hypothetical protein
MLKKCFLYLFFSLLLCVPNKARNFEQGYKKINFGFHYRSFWADRYYTQFSITEKKTTQLDHAFGFSVENVRFDYGKYYKGSRATLNWDFRYDKVFNPYLGISTINETGLSSKFKSTIQDLDGYDMVAGISFNILKVFRPYVEYSVYSSLFYFGFNVHIPLTITRPYKISFGF